MAYYLEQGNYHIATETPNDTDGLVLDHQFYLTSQIQFAYGYTFMMSDYMNLQEVGESVTGCLMLAMSGFGLITNIINMIVFFRQGIMSESCTTSLTILSVSDFCVNCLTFADGAAAVHSSVEYLSYLEGTNVLFIAKVISRPYPMFTLYTCFVTAYLAFERMICVLAPFRVKGLFTPLRTAIINVIMFCLLFITNFPINARYKLEKLDDGHQVLLRFDETQLSTPYLDNLANTLNKAYLRIGSIVLVIIFNIVVAARVIMSLRFRNAKSSAVSMKESGVGGTKDNSNSKPTGNKLSKEMRLVSMMAVLCLMLVVSYLPSVILYYAPWWKGRYFFELSSKFLETVNSSCNILVYYTMSTKYRKELTLLCCSRCKRTK